MTTTTAVPTGADLPAAAPLTVEENIYEAGFMAALLASAQEDIPAAGAGLQAVIDRWRDGYFTYILGRSQPPRCPNPECDEGLLRGTFVGCAICERPVTPERIRRAQADRGLSHV